jgi:prepilin-type N-terminal cleavage/methylation domain-containing protein
MKIAAIPCSSSPRRRPAYTLVELLVVISIVAILATLAFSATRAVLGNAHRLRTKTQIVSLQNAVHDYFTQYNRMPGTGRADEVVRLNQSTPLLGILLGDVSGPGSANPAGTAFLTSPPAKSGRNGLLEHGDGYLSLVDHWGNPYFLILDRDLDGRVPNPDAKNEDATISRAAPQWLRRRAAAFSAGLDGAVGTRDDIVSWR